MATTMNVQLTDSQMERLNHLAEWFQKPFNEFVARLLEESLREIDFPNIEFRESFKEREAFLKGIRLKVWHLRMYSELDEADIPRIAEDFDVTIETVTDAFSYARTYRDEIEGALALNRYISDNIEQFIPGIQIFRVDASDS